MFLIRSYDAGRCSVAQCYDNTWAMLAQSNWANIVNGSTVQLNSKLTLECRDSRVIFNLSRVTHQNTRVNRE